MSDRAAALVAAASKTASGMGDVAGKKPDATPLQSDARTFRGIAEMLTGLAGEVRERDEAVAQLRRILQRMAMLEVRGAAELVERGDWKALVGELQSMAQDVLNGRGAQATSRR